MLPDATLPVPASFMALLSSFGPLFTTPSFRTFWGLACGFLAQTGKRTVCGMLTGAGLSRLWSHDRAHRFFSSARWDPDELGLAVAAAGVQFELNHVQRRQHPAGSSRTAPMTANTAARSRSRIRGATRPARRGPAGR